MQATPMMAHAIRSPRPKYREYVLPAAMTSALTRPLKGDSNGETRQGHSEHAASDRYQGNRKEGYVERGERPAQGLRCNQASLGDDRERKEATDARYVGSQEGGVLHP
jgi:hypothetical protein